jgi:hypothetical protein
MMLRVATLLPERYHGEYAVYMQEVGKLAVGESASGDGPLTDSPTYSLTDSV